MEMNKWLNSGKYLPKVMRDFHDQKDIFKDMHQNYDQGDHTFLPPSWVDGHCYVVDWFLWYMAARGYTLQKSRTRVEFFEFEKPKYPSIL